MLSSRKHDLPESGFGSRADALFSAYPDSCRCRVVDGLNVSGHNLLHYFVHVPSYGVHRKGPSHFASIYTTFAQVHHIVQRRLGEVRAVPSDVVDTVASHAFEPIGRTLVA